MTKKQDGGPAFPHQFEDVHGHPSWHQSNGMTLRDYFAGQVLMSLGGTNPHLPDDPADPLNWPDPTNLVMRRAKFAYLQADAMIAARGQA